MTLCLTLAVLLQAAPVVEAAARPQPVLVVEGPVARTLNFDAVINGQAFPSFQRIDLMDLTSRAGPAG